MISEFKSLIDLLLIECPSYQTNGNFVMEQSTTSQETIFKHILLDCLSVTNSQTDLMLCIPQCLNSLDYLDKLETYLTSNTSNHSNISVRTINNDLIYVKLLTKNQTELLHINIVVCIPHTSLSYCNPNNKSSVYILNDPLKDKFVNNSIDIINSFNISTLNKVLVESSQSNLINITKNHNFVQLNEYDTQVVNNCTQIDLNNLILTIKNNLLDFDLLQPQKNYYPNSNIFQTNKEKYSERFSYNGQQLTIEEVFYFNKILLDSLTDNNQTIDCYISSSDLDSIPDNLYTFINNTILNYDPKINFIISNDKNNNKITLTIFVNGSIEYNSVITFIHTNQIWNATYNSNPKANVLYVFYMRYVNTVKVHNFLESSFLTRYASISIPDSSLKNMFNCYTPKTKLKFMSDFIEPVVCTVDDSGIPDHELLNQYKSLGSFDSLYDIVTKHYSDKLLLNDYSKLGTPDSIKEKLSLFNKLYSILHPKIVDDFKQNKFDCIVDPEQLKFLD